MNFEHSKSRREVPVVELSEIDVSLMNANEIHDLLVETVVGQGIDPSDALYVGLDASIDDPLVHGFGDRVTTWAFKGDQFKAVVQHDTANGAHSTDSPLFYALTGSEKPLVLVLDGSKFENALGKAKTDDEWEDSIHSDLEYHVTLGVSFEDTVVAALRIAQ